MADPIADQVSPHEPLPEPVESSSLVLTGDPLHLLEQMTAEVRAARATLAATANFKFFCVVIPEDGPHSVSDFDDVSKLLVFLRDLAAKTKTHPVPPSVQIFRGERWGITKGPHRRLVEPGNRRIFSINFEDDNIDIDLTGSIGS